MEANELDEIELDIELTWMPVYWERLLAGTTHMDSSEFGGYMLLIAEQWKKGFVPADIKKLMKITRIRSKDKLDTVLEKFKPNSKGNLVNQVCADVRIEQVSKYLKSKSSGKKGAEKRWQKDGDPIRVPKVSANGNPTVSAIADIKKEELRDTNVSNQQQHTHEVFSKKLFSETGGLDKQNIELQLNPRRLLTETDCEEFNRHLQTEGKHHVHWSEYIKHLRNWLNTRPSNTKKTETGRVSQPQKQTAEDYLTINQLAKDGISQEN